eukprot:CAMPEP_0183575190 /NCGR_PEP_ID=MMETSP0371-20130417/135050_1 /TAXON_ID=268820 /ORGANISM="Peridinium aciculiferum, Strain PAER-2" /LENGTH=30 /DNA_ID= /DNA_START= /DNA_END= /DNA_ORIENTATION=
MRGYTPTRSPRSLPDALQRGANPSLKEPKC